MVVQFILLTQLEAVQLEVKIGCDMDIPNGSFRMAPLIAHLAGHSVRQRSLGGRYLLIDLI